MDQPIEARYHNSLLFKYDIEDETQCFKSILNSVQPVFVLKYDVTSQYFNRSLLKSISRYFFCLFPNTCNFNILN
jgi:hypothetical protein